MTRPSVEVIIPTYNRAAVLQDTLSQVRALYPELPVCLGVQGAGLDPGMSDRFVRVERLTAPGTTRALNHCISTSSADVLLIIDDDAAPCAGWMESHLEAFAREPDLSYTCGREIRMRNGRSPFAGLLLFAVESLFRPFLPDDVALQGRIVGWTSSLGLIFGNYDRPGTCRINTPRGCNMAVRRSIFDRIGGFNASFTGNAWGFEADFGLRVARAGGYGRYVGSAAVKHYEVAAGGSRHGSKVRWYRDYLHNHALLIGQIGPQAWIGSLPRLIKRAVWMVAG